jgi:hypothetical protein
MSIVLAEYTAEDQRSFVLFFLWAKVLNAKDIHKEMTPVYGGKCDFQLSSPLKKYLGGKYFADDEEVETEVRNWMRRLSKDFCAAGFDALVKRWASVSMLAEDMSRNTCFSGIEYHMIYVLHPFVTYLLTPPRKIVIKREITDHSCKK